MDVKVLYMAGICPVGAFDDRYWGGPDRRADLPTRTPTMLSMPKAPLTPDVADHPGPAVGAVSSDPPADRPPLWRRGWVYDVLAVVLFVLFAIAVTGHYWGDPADRVGGNPPDQTLFEWMLSHAAWSLAHLQNPLFSDRLGAPEGVNVMGNTSVLALGIPLSPVTLIWGPGVAYAVMITFGFAATGVAWYFVLSRYAGLSRLAAFVGAGFCAFSPGMLSQGGGHPQIQVQFLLPLIAWRVFRLRAATHPVRDGIVLGLLISIQVFIGEETLFITAMAVSVCALVYAVARRRAVLAELRPLLTGLLAAGAVAAVLLAYPLYVQFFGPRSYGYLAWIPNFHGDLVAFTRYSPMTVAGAPAVHLDPRGYDVTEMNASFGWPLLVLVPIMLVWLRRSLAAWTAAIVGVLFAAFALGNEIYLDGRATGVPGLWHVLGALPVFRVVLSTRFTLVTAVAIGVLLALTVDRAIRSSGRRLLGVPWPVVAWAVPIIAVLAPLAPLPLTAVGAPPPPAFFASGAYRPYLGGDRAISVVPPTTDNQRALTQWAADEHDDFRITEGRFLAPIPGSPDKEGTLSRPATHLGDLTGRAARKGKSPAITDADRTAVRDELRTHGVALVVMPASQRNGVEVRATTDALLGPGLLVQGTWVWDLRALG
jgi:hypothetical protein